MSKTYIGDSLGKGLRIGIAVSRFNETVTTLLLEGAIEGLTANGVSRQSVDIAWTPGALELPIVAKQMAASGHYDAVICVGAVIRGETAHFDYVSAGAQQGIVQAALETGIPIMFGVLTTDNVDQAMARSGGNKGNKGFDAAAGAIEMANLLKSLPGSYS